MYHLTKARGSIFGWRMCVFLLLAGSGYAGAFSVFAALVNEIGAYILLYSVLQIT